MSVKHGMEPMRLIKTASSDHQRTTTSVQKVKESGLMKRANFLDEYKSGTGSFIKDEDVHNSSTNNNRTKVATSKRSEEVLEIEAFEPSENFGASAYHSRPHDSRLIKEHIGHSAL